MMFDKSIEQAMRDHALKEYPSECCGVVVDNTYIPMVNISSTPREHFEIDSGEYLKLSKIGAIQAIIHSHTNGNAAPSAADIQGQMTSNVPWGIILTDGNNTKDPFYFGDGVPKLPLVGRPYQHGINDCFTLIRDYYKQEKNITLPDYPREDGRWQQGQNLYLDNYQSAGFELIDAKQIKAGDVFLAQIKSDVPNHGGVLYADNGLILHHLCERLSVIEPVHRWQKYITHWLRYRP